METSQDTALTDQLTNERSLILSSRSHLNIQLIAIKPRRLLLGLIFSLLSDQICVTKNILLEKSVVFKTAY